MLSAYKGPAAQAAILTGDAQGVVRLAVPSGEAWKTVAVEHFSPWYLVDADDPAWIPAFDTVAQDGEAAAKDAAAILKQPIDVPAAPSIPFACPDKNGSSAKPDPIAAFIEQLRAPEAGLIARIVAGAHQQLLAGASHEDQLDVANQLMSRLVKKAAAMLKATKPTADTVLPAAIAATAISRQALSMAVDYSDLGAAIPVFVDAALKDTIGRIRRDHDYRQIQVIWSIASQSALLGGGATGPDVDGALARALQFNANLSVDESSPEATWAMSGIVRMEYPGPQDPNGDVLKGEARISDITYRDTIGLTLNPVPFRVQASLADVDACAGTASFGVSQFYMDNESYKDDKGGGMKLGRSWINWEYFYGDKGGRDGWTWFPVKLHNGDPQWVDETIQAGDDGWFAEFSIVLNHQGS